VNNETGDPRGAAQSSDELVDPKPPELDAIRAAAARIAPWIHRTPVMTSTSINTRVGADLYFKCENLQKTGAFKIRGATNAVLSLPESIAARGVATHSSGNHAAALALAASRRGIKAQVVMPENAAKVKRAAAQRYGAEIITCANSLSSREDTLSQLVERTGAVVVHPFDDYRIIAGQATAGLELLQDIPDLDVMITPVGGGGLTSGVALVSHYLNPDITMLAAEPAGAADAHASKQAGHLVPLQNPRTMADGLRTSLGDKTFAILGELVAEVLLASERGIAVAMRMIWERMKIVVEPSAAVALAALIEHPDSVAGKRVGVILSGGNVDLERRDWLAAT